MRYPSRPSPGEIARDDNVWECSISGHSANPGPVAFNEFQEKQPNPSFPIRTTGELHFIIIRIFY